MYINKETLQYPVSERQIKYEFPHIMFGKPFSPPEPYAVVFPYPKPSYDPLVQTIREIAPRETTKGNYEQQWEVIPKFSDYTDHEDVFHSREQQEFDAILTHRTSMKENKMQEIYKDFADAIALMTANYPEDEVKSWDQQKEEARAWELNPTTHTPLLDSMIAESGETKAELASLILANAAAFANYYGTHLGKKRARIDVLKSIDLTSDDALEQIAEV